MDKIGVAIFGAGRAGNIHFRNAISNYRVKVLWLVDQDINKAQELVEKYRQADIQITTSDNMAAVLSDSRVQGVLVCSPTFTHEEIVRAALMNGKAVFCEKPISEDIEGTEACYKLAEEVKLPLLCSFNRRFDPSVNSLKNRVLAGEIGNIHVIKTTSRDNPFPPIEYLRISGGIFHDCAVHDIDMVCWIVGEYPVTVYTQAHTHSKELRDMNDVDTVNISMKFASGVLATIDLSRHGMYGYDQRLEVLGSEGMLVSENHRKTEVHFHSKDGTNVGNIEHSFPQRYAESYIKALDNFLDVIEGSGTVSISGENTLKITMIASACEKSHHCGKPIHLDFSSSDYDSVTSLQSPKHIKMDVSAADKPTEVEEVLSQ